MRAHHDGAAAAGRFTFPFVRHLGVNQRVRALLHMLFRAPHLPQTKTGANMMGSAAFFAGSWMALDQRRLSPFHARRCSLPSANAASGPSTVVAGMLQALSMPAAQLQV